LFSGEEQSIYIHIEPKQNIEITGTYYEKITNNLYSLASFAIESVYPSTEKYEHVELFKTHAFDFILVLTHIWLYADKNISVSDSTWKECNLCCMNTNEIDFSMQDIQIELKSLNSICDIQVPCVEDKLFVEIETTFLMPFKKLSLANTESDVKPFIQNEFYKKLFDECFITYIMILSSKRPLLHDYHVSLLTSSVVYIACHKHASSKSLSKNAPTSSDRFLTLLRMFIRSEIANQYVSLYMLRTAIEYEETFFKENFPSADGGSRISTTFESTAEFGKAFQEYHNFVSQTAIPKHIIEITKPFAPSKFDGKKEMYETVFKLTKDFELVDLSKFERKSNSDPNTYKIVRNVYDRFTYKNTSKRLVRIIDSSKPLTSPLSERTQLIFDAVMIGLALANKFVCVDAGLISSTTYFLVNLQTNNYISNIEGWVGPRYAKSL